jgi:hypothetical protein
MKLCVKAWVFLLIWALLVDCGLAKEREPKKLKIWVHHHIKWWSNYWGKNCALDNPRHANGLLPILNFKYKGKGFEESLAEFSRVVDNERKLGFDVIPTFNARIHQGYKKGTEFQAWFDEAGWAERANWFEAMLAKVDGKRVGLDVEPYWKGENSNRRYPKPRHRARLAKAIRPFIDVLIENDVELYVFPGSINFVWIQEAATRGVRLVSLDERTYGLPDYYQSEPEKYQEKLEEITKNKKDAEAMGMRYVPGFYETALKRPGFLEAIQDLGYREIWIFLRRDGKVHRYHKFCLPEFYDLKPYGFEN